MADRPEAGRRPVLLVGGAAAHELVPLQGGGDLKVGTVGIRAGTNPVGAQDLPHATQADGLRAFAVQDNHVFDGPTEIGLSFGSEQHSTGTDVLGKTRKRHTFGTGTGNGERELKLKTPGSSLFHGLSDSDSRCCSHSRSIELEYRNGPKVLCGRIGSTERGIQEAYGLATSQILMHGDNPRAGWTEAAAFWLSGEPGTGKGGLKGLQTT